MAPVKNRPAQIGPMPPSQQLAWTGIACTSSEPTSTHVASTRPARRIRVPRTPVIHVGGVGVYRGIPVPDAPMTWDCSHELSRIASAPAGSLADVPSGKRLQISDNVVRSSFLDHIKSGLVLERADWIILDVAKRRRRIVAQVNSG